MEEIKLLFDSKRPGYWGVTRLVVLDYQGENFLKYNKIPKKTAVNLMCAGLREVGPNHGVVRASVPPNGTGKNAPRLDDGCPSNTVEFAPEHGVVQMPTSPRQKSQKPRIAASVARVS